MPQMAPMMWTTLYFYPLLMIILCSILLSTSKNFTYKSEAKVEAKSVSNNWMW